MTDLEALLADWKAKTDAATEGRWEVVLEGGPPAIKMPEGDSYGWVSECSSGVWNCDDPYDDCWRYAAAATNEAEFIAMSRTAMPRILAAIESVLALCDDPGGPTSWSHLFDGRQSVFVDDIRRAITDALGGSEPDEGSKR